MCLMCFKHCDYVKLFQSETLIEQGHLKPQGQEGSLSFVYLRWH